MVEVRNKMALVTIKRDNIERAVQDILKMIFREFERDGYTITDRAREKWSDEVLNDVDDIIKLSKDREGNFLEGRYRRAFREYKEELKDVIQKDVEIENDWIEVESRISDMVLRVIQRAHDVGIRLSRYEEKRLRDNVLDNYVGKWEKYRENGQEVPEDFYRELETLEDIIYKELMQFKI